MLFDDIKNSLRDVIECTSDSFGLLVLEVRIEHLHAVIVRLQQAFGFTLLLDITAVDYPERTPRFDVVYHLYSRAHNQRLRIKSAVSESQPIAPTVTDLYGSARYIEREVHDMYGVVFEGNGDLRPILLYEGFIGHPLRKDYAMDAEQPIVSYRQ